MKTHSTKKPWGAMSAAELAEATREFDHPLPRSRSKSLSKAERALFERASRAGEVGRRLVSALRLDPKLLTRAEAYAKRKRLTLAQLVERGIRRELAAKD